MFVEICLYPGDVAYEDDNDKDDIVIIMISLMIMILMIHSIHLTHNAAANDDNNDKYFYGDGDYNNDDDDNEDVDDKVEKGVGDRLHLNPDACPARRRAQLAAVALAIRVGGELVKDVLINFVV